MHSLKALILVTILSLTGVSVSQAQQKLPPQEKMECGTIIPPVQLRAELARKSSAAARQTSPPIDAPYYLPLTIHIVHRTDGTEGMTLRELEAAMQDLNGKWQQVGVQFVVYGDVDHINDDTHYQILDTPDKRDGLRRINAVPDTINVYFANLGPLCGLASFTEEAVQGVLMDSGCAGGGYFLDRNRSVFAHEIGHYFDLYHTHETMFGIDCPSGGDCDDDGDLLCDTAADPGLITPMRSSRVDYNCVYDNSAELPASCDDDTPYNPPVDNLMSYSYKTCRTEFTPSQISKILYVLQHSGKRKKLMTTGTRYVDPQASDSNKNCTYNSPCNRTSKAVAAAADGNFIFLKPGVHQASTVGGKRVTVSRWGTEGVVEIVP